MKRLTTFGVLLAVIPATDAATIFASGQLLIPGDPAIPFG